MFFRIRNAVSQDVELLEKPWEFDTSSFPKGLSNEQYKAWWKSRDANGCLISLTATDYHTGAYGYRCNTRTHLPTVIYGLKADYDNTELTEAQLIDQASRLPRGCEYLPTWASLSYGGHMHLYWLFEAPVRLIDMDHARTFMRYAMSKIGAKLFGVMPTDYDDNASTNLTQYFDIGKNWVKIGDGGTIPRGVLYTWSYEAARSTAEKRINRTRGGISIPLDRLGEMLRKTFPDVTFPSQLYYGMRIRRFWDPLADNPSGAALVEDGFQVFTPHDNGFRSWASLFGERAIEDYLGNTKFHALDDIWSVHMRNTVKFVCRMDTDENRPERYSVVDQTMLRTILRRAGFSANTPKAGGVSQVDEAIVHVFQKKIVDAVVPLPYYEPGVIINPEGMLPGRYINSCGHIRVTDPSLDEYDGGCTWENPQALLRFPLIYKLLTYMFCHDKTEWDTFIESRKTYAGSANCQLMVFLSWLAHFYRSAYFRRPSIGQALYLVGKPGCGKSLLMQTIIPRLMGVKAENGAQYFVDGQHFSKSIVETSVIVLDDVIPKVDSRARDEATARIKSFVATGTINYEPKGVDAVTVPYRGRLIVASNDTARDLAILPALDSSTLDKFTLLRVGTFPAPAEYVFPAGRGREADEIFDREIPEFAKFLEGFSIPKELKDIRFGVSSYQEPSLYLASQMQGPAAAFLSLLGVYLVHHICPDDPAGRSTPDLKRMIEIIETKSPLQMTSRNLWNKVIELNPSAQKGMTVNSMNAMLTALSSIPTYAPFVKLCEHQGSTQATWRLDFRILFVFYGKDLKGLEYDL